MAAGRRLGRVVSAPRRRPLTKAEWLASLPPALPKGPSTDGDQRARDDAHAMLHDYWYGDGQAPRCVWCGCANPLALQIDHVNSDGAEARKRFTGGPQTWYALLRGDIDCATVQLLCANCNGEKRAYEKRHGLVRSRGHKSVLDKTTGLVVSYTCG